MRSFVFERWEQFAEEIIQDGYGNSCIFRNVYSTWPCLSCWPIILVVFLLTSSVATVAICCLELKAVWISYRQVSPLCWMENNWELNYHQMTSGTCEITFCWMKTCYCAGERISQRSKWFEICYSYDDGNSTLWSIYPFFDVGWIYATSTKLWVNVIIQNNVGISEGQLSE